MARRATAVADRQTWPSQGGDDLCPDRDHSQKQSKRGQGSRLFDHHPEHPTLLLIRTNKEHSSYFVLVKRAVFPTFSPDQPVTDDLALPQRLSKGLQPFGEIQCAQLVWRWVLRSLWVVALAGRRSWSQSFKLRTDIRMARPSRLRSKPISEKVKDLASEQGLKVGQKVAAGVAGLVVWPLLFAMDFQDSASKEVAALQSRQQYLATLAEQRYAAAAVPQAAQVRKR